MENWRVKYSALISLMVVIFLLGCSLAVQGSIRVEPSRFIFNINPGERDTGAITVKNNSDRELFLTANFYDWLLDERNEMVFWDSGTLEATLAGLIRFNPRQFTLSPGESQIVRFTVEMPPDDEEPFERRGIIFFEHEEPFEEEGIGASIKTMIGTTIYVMPREYRLSFHIIDGMVHVTADQVCLAALLLGSDALVHTRFTIHYRVVAPGGRLIEEGQQREMVILPEEIRPVFFPLEQVQEPGDYRLMIEINFAGTDYKMTDILPFTVLE